MKQARDLLALVALFALLAAFTVYGPGRTPASEDGRRGSANSKGEEGTLGLQLWLRSLGYEARNLQYETWSVPPTAHALLMIAAERERVTDDERDSILEWVRGGGTLIAIAERPTQAFNPNPIWSSLGATIVQAQADGEPQERAVAAQPILRAPPVTSVQVQTSQGIELEEPSFVTLLETEHGPALVGRQLDQGYVYLGVSAEPFTNRGLQRPGSGALLLNLLARVPANGVVLFDEYHHGFRVAPTPQSLLTSSWWGWSVLYTLLVIGLYIVMTGKRFGRPLPVRQEVARRSAAEYVVSMAQLFRRAGKRQDIALHYHTQLKRRLAQPYGFVPPADDEQFLFELARWSDVAQARRGELHQLLNRLRSPRLSEGELVQLAQTVDQFTDRKGRIL